jgi:hypothetical protein
MGTAVALVERGNRVRVRDWGPGDLSEDELLSKVKLEDISKT